jgi:hypothetical protein
MTICDHIISCGRGNYLFLLFVISLTCVVNNFTKAQNMVAKLSDEEIVVVIPLLKSQLAGYENVVNAIANEQDKRYQLFLDIKSGKTDPLDWLKQYSKHIIVPQGAIYEPACSRAVSIKGWEYHQDPESYIKPSAVPTAIFSFGKEFSAINKELLGKNISSESYQKFLYNSINQNDPVYKKIHEILEETRLFYVKNGLSASYGLSGGRVVSFYHPDEEGLISGIVCDIDETLFDPAYPELITECRSHLMGPCIEIKAEYELLDNIFKTDESTDQIDENIKNSLKKVNIDEERYALIKITLLQAQMDCQNPDGIEVPSIDINPTTQEEKETAMIIEKMKEDALARKSNIEIYNKYKSELDPICNDLQKYMGGQY